MAGETHLMKIFCLDYGDLPADAIRVLLHRKEQFGSEMLPAHWIEYSQMFKAEFILHIQYAFPYTILS